MNNRPLMISIAGESGSGKTTLIVKLIETLKGKGIKVGAVKHTHHLVTLDTKGKDSWKFAQAGSNPTVLLNDNFTGTMERRERPVEMDELEASFTGKADIVLVEGFKKESSLVTILFLNNRGQTPLEENASVIAYVTKTGEMANMELLKKPVFIRDDIDTIAELILSLYEKHNV